MLLNEPIAVVCFKGGAFVIIAMNRIQTMHLHPPEVHLDDVKENPYRLRAFRKFIDGGAFRIYGHWVKKGENQNRAALFENNIKRDMIQLARWWWPWPLCSIHQFQFPSIYFLSAECSSVYVFFFYKTSLAKKLSGEIFEEKSPFPYRWTNFCLIMWTSVFLTSLTAAFSHFQNRIVKC